MSIAPNEFRERIIEMVRTHYASNRAPLLLARLGAELDHADAWPTDRGQRSLKQLIKDCASPELEVLWDKSSPAYIAVVTPDAREEVLNQIGQRSAGMAAGAVRLEDIARPVLLAFCVDTHDQAVYVRRTRPFRYEVGNIQPNQASEFVIVEPEYRRPGLRIERPQSLTPTDRRDLEGRIQRWATIHGLRIDQFSRLTQDDKEGVDTKQTALDRLLAAQPPDVAQRLVIPADIAQILARIR
jgi:hypothetical protein